VTDKSPSHHTNAISNIHVIGYNLQIQASLSKGLGMSAQLKRQVGMFGAVMMGLGSIIGTGVFVSIGIGAGLAGPAVIVAIIVGAFVATFNGLSSAQLAANHPVSGGTYEYGYRYLNPTFGFIAGWTFLLAKSASAATAALGASAYFGDLIGLEGTWRVPLAFFIVILFTILLLGGLKRSNAVNTVIVSITLLALTAFVVGGIPNISGDNLTPFFEDDFTIQNLLYASALMFVAYTGYGRIATLGEEVHNPRKIIPRAIIITLIVTMTLYISVGIVAIGTVGASTLSTAISTNSAPLENAAQSFSPAIATFIAIGAITAMLGVLLNLILGLSRVLLAMGRRGDMPKITARLNSSQTTPTIAVIVMGGVIAGLVLIGNVKTTWSFSAFNVLIYYSITNLSTFRLSAEERLFPRWIAVCGLISCLFLAFWVDVTIWLVGLGIIAIGIFWKQVIAQRFFRTT
jgi:APA family basic amino acid/polyamine antiporter